MKKAAIASALALALFAITSCGNDHKPKTDLNEQEQSSVDSLINNDQAQMDSLENAIKAQIGEDTESTESVHEGHDHEDHSH